MQLVLVDTWLKLWWPRPSNSPPTPNKPLSPRPPSSVMDLDEVEEEVEKEVEEEAEEGDDEDVDEETGVPGTLEIVAGDCLEPSSSRINCKFFT